MAKFNAPIEGQLKGYLLYGVFSNLSEGKTNFSACLLVAYFSAIMVIVLIISISVFLPGCWAVSGTFCVSNSMYINSVHVC